MKIYRFIPLALAAVLLAGCGAQAIDTSESTAPPVSIPADVTTPPPPPPSVYGFGDGDYQVGVDIQPGTYVSPGATHGVFELCLASTTTSDGTVGELESANADEQVILTVTENDDVVSISGCDPFVLR